MIARVVQSVVLIVLSSVTLTGCGRQVSKDSTPNFDLLATGPAQQVLPTPPPYVVAALDAAGGLTAWEQCKRVEFRATGTACARAGCYYLTEHDFVVCPWSEAIQVTAHEPRADFTWQVVRGRRYAQQADPNLDVSPLRGLCCDYADAVLRIATAPVRLLEDQAGLTSRPGVVQISGQWYLPIDANYPAQKAGPSEKVAAAPYWTEGTYFQSQGKSLVDMIWLGNPATHKFLLARGYDYAPAVAGGALIPSKIEVFQSDPEANIGPRLALIDVKR
jgi:hypothetical protein